MPPPLPAPRPVPPSRGVPGWLVSWPAIIVGFFVCLIPGFVLLWMRPGTSAKVKSAVTVSVVAILVVGAVTSPPPTQPLADAVAPRAVATSASVEPTTAPPVS